MQTSYVSSIFLLFKKLVNSEIWVSAYTSFYIYSSKFCQILWHYTINSVFYDWILSVFSTLLVTRHNRMEPKDNRSLSNIMEHLENKFHQTLFLLTCWTKNHDAVGSAVPLSKFIKAEPWFYCHYFLNYQGSCCFPGKNKLVFTNMSWNHESLLKDKCDLLTGAVKRSLLSETIHVVISFSKGDANHPS